MEDTGVCRADVERLCGYITSDRSVASYFRISIEQVQVIRAGIKPVVDKRFRKERNCGDTYTKAKGKEPVGCDLVYVRRQAENNNRAFLDRLGAFFEAEATRNGWTVEEARTFHVRGVHPDEVRAYMSLQLDRGAVPMPQPLMQGGAAA